MSDEPNAPANPAPPSCACMGLGPALTELVRQLGPSDEVMRHLRGAQVEVLRAVRTIIDQRIDALTQAQDRETPKGTRLTVE